MSTPDSFLIMWWSLIAIIGLSSLLVVHHRCGAVGGPSVSTPATALSGIAKLGIVFSGAVLFAGTLVFSWMGHWTKLLFLNFQFSFVLFGAVGITAALSPKMSAAMANRPFLWPRSMTRPIMLLLGLLALAFGSYRLIGDFVLPQLVVEGRINSVSRSSMKMDTYSIVIDGHAYGTLRDVFLAVKTGDRVRAEVGAGSKTVLHAKRIGSRAQ
jgi:hypothetical protein